MEFHDADTSEIIERKIQAICAVNQEIIERINHKLNSDEQMIVYEYLVQLDHSPSERQPHSFKVVELQNILKYKQIIDEWEVPSSLEVPVDPDPNETLYGKNKEIMNMNCKKYPDLIRINQQLVVAQLYTSMLREPIAVQFGKKFKYNFEVLQVLLGNLDSALTSTGSVLQEKQNAINQVNDQIAQIFYSSSIMLSRTPYSFAGQSLVATMTTAYPISKGSLLTAGIHQWRVRCVNVVASFDLGVAAPAHTSHFGTGSGTAWGLRETGHIFPSGTQSNCPYKTGDVLTFHLNCTTRTLTITVSNKSPFVIPNIVLPVHIAFSGPAGTKAEILL